MFTGIIEEIGVVENIVATPAGRRIAIISGTVAAGAERGASVALNGVCVTVVECSPPVSASRKGRLAADILKKTWELTNLNALKPNEGVNLERALRLGDRIGGHFVLGHVDGQGTIISRRSEGDDLVLGISVGGALMEGIVLRGSIAVDGISLTVARTDADAFYVHCIPFTLQNTTLGSRQVGGRVNIELDVLDRYASRKRAQGITESFLREHGFL